MKTIYVITLLVFSLFTGCSESSNSDSESTDCATVTKGVDYAVTAYTCDGTSTLDSAANVVFTFNEDGTLTQKQGPDECRTVITWNVDFTGGVFNQTGVSIACEANGTSIAVCSSSSNNCSESTIDQSSPTTNNYSSCARSGNVLTFSRTTTAAQVGLVSDCTEGQTEVSAITRQ